MEVRRPVAFDWVLAAVVAGFGVVDLVDTVRGPRVVAAGAVTVYVLCLLIRRTSLWAAVIVAFATMLISYQLGLSQQDFLASIIACLVLVWWVGYALRTAEALLGLGYAYVCVIATNGVDVASVVWLALVIGGAWGAGRALRSRHLLIEDLRRTTGELERSRDELAARAVIAERLRIAQDIHDIVAHSVTVMLVQAEAAERVMPAGRGSAEATEAVRAVQDSGRNALAELRRLLGVLRPTARADTVPQPGLADLAALVDSYRGAGLGVQFTAPAVGDVAPGTELTAYRVVQEGLTNVLRHSTASHVRVDLRLSKGSLLVEVTDDGPARPSDDPPGHGLVGMRERVLAGGGVLEAGPCGSGFRVAATLPVTHPAAVAS
ncbi:sensor histidine kinase [Calidifontibacter terrae]